MFKNPNGVSSQYRQAEAGSGLRRQFRERLGMPALSQRLAHQDGMLARRNARPHPGLPAAPAALQARGGMAALGSPRAALPQAPQQMAPARSRPQPQPTVTEPEEPPVYDLPQVARGKGTGARPIRRGLMQLSAQNAKRADPMIWGLIDQLSQRAKTYDPYTVAAERAGEYEALNDSMSQATGQLDRTLRDRGLTESSYGGAAYGALAAQGANSRAGLTRAVQREARTDQQQASAQLMDLLNALQGRHTNTAMSAAQGIIADQMRQQELDQAGQFDLGGLLSSAMGAAGSYYGLKAR